MADGCHFESRYIAISQRKIIRFCTAADFELDERHVIKNIKKLHWTDSEFDRTYFLLIKYISVDDRLITSVTDIRNNDSKKI